MSSSAAKLKGLTDPAHSRSNRGLSSVVVRRRRSSRRSCTFGTALLLFPFPGIGLRIGKKEVEVLVQGGLILLGNEHIVPPEADGICTELVLGMHRIGSHDTALDQSWAEPG